MSIHADAQVPLVDLGAQYAVIKGEVTSGIEEVLASAQFVGGRWVEQFEDEFARYVGARFAIGVGSGTAALELALRAGGIGPGDEVIVPANSFFATAEAVSNVGAKPAFADVDALTFHLDVASAERVLTPHTRGIIPVHLYGRAMDLTEVERLAAMHDLLVIEDAAQAHGAGRNGVKVGASDGMTCFSFYPGKNLGAYGDGGAITTNDSAIAEKLRLLRDHGSPTKYQHIIIGTNSRLDAIQARVLSAKLRHLDQWNAMRLAHALAYVRALADSGIHLPEIPPSGEHVFHLFVICSRHRDAIRESLARRHVSTGIHYPVPLHLTPAYQAMGYPARGTFPVAETLADTVLSLPMYPELTEAQVTKTTLALLESAAIPETVLP